MQGCSLALDIYSQSGRTNGIQEKISRRPSAAQEIYKWDKAVISRGQPASPELNFLTSLWCVDRDGEKALSLPGSVTQL